MSGLERGQVRRPQRGTVQRLVTALALTGRDAERFVAVARGHQLPYVAVEADAGPPSAVPFAAGSSGSAVPFGSTAPGPFAIPAQLPSDVRPFRGRGRHLAVLDRVLGSNVVTDHSPGVCLLTGPTGVGKTALAVHWAHRTSGHFPDGQLFLDLRGHGRQHPIDPADALAVLLRSLGLDDGAMATWVAERSGQLRSLLARRRVLLVLDDASTIDQVRPLLPGSGRSFCLITSQSRLPGLVAREGGTTLPLDLFELDEATSLLAELIPAESGTGSGTGARHREVLERIAERCDGLPLALRIAAERILTHPELPLQAHADQLDEAGPLEALHTGGDERTAIRTVLAWSVDRLEPAARTAFEQLGAHPGREWDTTAAAVVIRCSQYEAAGLLESLARAHLLHRTGPDRWRQHELLRAFSAERAAAAPSRRRDAVAALSEHYLSCAGAALDLLLPGERDLRPAVRPPAGVAVPWARADGEDQALAGARDWLRREEPNVIALIRQAHEDGLHEHALRLAVMWRRPLELSGAHGDGLEAFRYAHASALQLKDRPGQADCLRALACLHYLRDEHDPSVRLFTQALEVARLLNDAARVCRALAGLGVTETRIGSHPSAGVHLEEALAVSDTAGDVTGALTVRVNLAFLDYRRGDLDRAAAKAQEALQGFRDAGSLHGEMHARQLLGDIRLAARAPRAAMEDFGRAWRCAEQLGDRTMLGKALIGTERALAAIGRDTDLEALRARVRALLADLGLDDEATRDLVAAR